MKKKESYERAFNCGEKTQELFGHQFLTWTQLVLKCVLPLAYAEVLKTLDIQEISTRKGLSSI